MVAVLGALLARGRTGRGQYIDVSVQEGVTALASVMLALFQRGQPVERGTSSFTGGAPWYAVYETSDGRHLAVGAIEPWFWAELCRRVDRPEWAAQQGDRAAWRAIHEELRRIFRAAPLDAWVERFSGADVCVTPVHTLDEVLADPQLATRGSFTPYQDANGNEYIGVRSAPPVAGASATARAPLPRPGADGREILADLGYGDDETRGLIASGGVGEPS